MATELISSYHVINRAAHESLQEHDELNVNAVCREACPGSGIQGQVLCTSALTLLEN